MESWVEPTSRSVAPMSVAASSLPSVLEPGIPPAPRSDLLRGNSSRFLGAFRSLERIPVAARDGPNAASDGVVHFVGQISQGYAQRPVWGLEAAAVQQHDPVVLCQTESEVEGMDVLLEVFDSVRSDVLTCPELEVDQTVVSVEQWVRGNFKAQTFEQGLRARVQDLHACLLIQLGFVHHLGKGKQAHHDLLGQPKASRVVEGHVPAVGNN